MNDEKKYHRTGEPGGPGCELSSLPVEAKNSEGITFSGQLLQAPESATELEMLRTVAHMKGVQWGKDKFGWWAAVLEQK